MKDVEFLSVPLAAGVEQAVPPLILQVKLSGPARPPRIGRIAAAEVRRRVHFILERLRDERVSTKLIQDDVTRWIEHSPCFLHLRCRWYRSTLYI